MLKFFDIEDSSCHIVLDAPLSKDDSKTLALLLEKEYLSWNIEFGHIYNIGVDILNTLYEAIFQKQKKVSITTHKSKLNRYLHSLGFKTHFVSLIKNEIVDINSIDVVVVGGSADSSTKIVEILKNATLQNITLVIVQHVEATRVGEFDVILQRLTTQKVSYAKDAQEIKKGQIYIAPANKHLKVINGNFYLSDDEKHNFAKPSISLSYESFSDFYKEKLLVIQECGYASDGVDKLQHLKENGSKLIIQEIAECKATPMISNAIDVGAHDFILTLEEIISFLNIVDMKLRKDEWIEYLLEKIYEIHNYDFRLYHKDMVRRRIDVYMLKHGIKDIKDTVVMILFHKNAFKSFFLELSINVTELFRKPESFKNSIKFLEKYHKKSRSIKIWSAGCSSGEEVYSMGILLDIMNLLEKSIIYATDFNSVVLQEAKNGVYSQEEYKIAQENFAKIGFKSDLNNYLTLNSNYITISEKIRDKTLFFQHNLIEDSSFNEFNIIICKNVIIYFDDNLQKKVFQLFYDSLKFGGHLVLGESEMIIPMFQEKFERCSENCKIFRKVA